MREEPDGNESQRAKATAFLDAISEVCRSHNCWLSGRFTVAVEPNKAMAIDLGDSIPFAYVDLQLSTGCDHVWMPDRDRPFEECSDCGLSRRVPVEEPA